MVIPEVAREGVAMQEVVMMFLSVSGYQTVSTVEVNITMDNALRMEKSV